MRRPLSVHGVLKRPFVLARLALQIRQSPSSPHPIQMHEKTGYRVKMILKAFTIKWSFCCQRHFMIPKMVTQQGQQCCSGAISICSTPGNPLEVIREVPHNLDPQPDMARALEKVKAARMKAIYRQ